MSKKDPSMTEERWNYLKALAPPSPRLFWNSDIHGTRKTHTLRAAQRSVRRKMKGIKRSGGTL